MDGKKSRALSKEKEKEPSFRFLYYGGSGAAVPFKWESQPGTPKHPLFSDYSSLPPLTPPPSFMARARARPDPNPRRRSSLKILVFLARLVRRGSHVSPSPSSLVSSPSVSSSMSSSSSLRYSSKGRKSRPLMFAYVDRQEEKEEVKMRMCFGGFKNKVLSVVGRGGARRRRSPSVTLD